MQIEEIKSLFIKYKEHELDGRYITNEHIKPLLHKIDDSVDVEVIGSSVLGKPIYALTIGHGPKKVLMWSQMHGNESTTTKSLFDLLNTLLAKEVDLSHILETCTIRIIPILNPDGAAVYTRINANEVDLNRDAQNLTQPESKVLRLVFDTFNPLFCYNLHGQRTIFSAGQSNKTATVSFLAPAQDKLCSITKTRKIAMEVISVMNDSLQQIIPNQVGVYDDAFNINCVGDTFQTNNVPTILFEAGHYQNDYEREKTREFIYISLLTSLNYISITNVKGDKYRAYMDIPENGKCFLDIIIRNAKINDKIIDVGIQYQEKLIGGNISFIPRVVKMDGLNGFYGHKEIEAECEELCELGGEPLRMDYENVFVILNNEKTLL